MNSQRNPYPETGMRWLRMPLCLLVMMAAISCAVIGGDNSLTEGPPQESPPGPPTRESVMEEQAQPQLLIGRWKDDKTGKIIAFTEDEYILYDFSDDIKELHIAYYITDDNKIQLDLDGSSPFEYQVEGDVLTLVRNDTVSTFTRVE
jgi:hypothetical protein